MMQERGKFVAGGGERAFAFLGDRSRSGGLKHYLTFRDLQRTRQGVTRELRRRFGNWPRERAGPRIRHHSPNQKVEVLVEKATAVENYPRLGKEEVRVSQVELIDDFTDLFNQICRGH